MKQLTETHLRRRGREWGEVKLGAGSIRDVEFVTQYLQLVHGKHHPEIHSPNTLNALSRLSASGLLSRDEGRVLRDGYVFLRTVEHHLQMMHYRQTNTLPNKQDALAHLARRLGFAGEAAGDQFLARYQQHGAAIRAVYLRYLGSDNMDESTISSASPVASTVRHHMERMDPSYAATFDDQEIKRHATLAEHLDDDHLVEVDAVPIEDGCWRVTIVAYDYPGELSLICGLLFVYGFSIYDGHVFTYEPLASQPAQPGRARRPSQPRRKVPHKSTHTASRQKIVDVFTVRPVQGEVIPDTWPRYAEDLAGLLGLMHIGQRREARGELAKRVAVALRDIGSPTATLYPIDIEIDNITSNQYSVLHIQSPDTIGFLYEFANALALSRIYIARVTVDSIGNRVHDTLYVTDWTGEKSPLPTNRGNCVLQPF